MQSLDQAGNEGRRQRERQRGEFLEVHSSRKVATLYTVPLRLYHKEQQVIEFGFYGAVTKISF